MWVTSDQSTHGQGWHKVGRLLHACTYPLLSLSGSLLSAPFQADPGLTLPFLLLLLLTPSGVFNLLPAPASLYGPQSGYENSTYTRHTSLCMHGFKDVTRMLASCYMLMHTWKSLCR